MQRQAQGRKREMPILVTGGAGYIGSHTVWELCEKGEDVVVFDNLSKGHREAIHKNARFFEGDLLGSGEIERVFAENEISAVIHFAAFSLVGESVECPLKYYENNIYGTTKLLAAMAGYHVKNIVFSSTAAAYGDPENIPILETDRTVPTNPYGETKLAMEKCLKWCSRAYGVKFTALRYFNAAGAKAGGVIGEDHTPETHLIPNVLKAARGKTELCVFGGDYDTPDGTCIRDFIHVTDLANAHILALKRLEEGGDNQIINLGSGKGFSVMEVIRAAEKVTGQTIPYQKCERRAGDPAKLIASSQKARELLKWIPKFDDLETMIATAWEFAEKHPDGYAARHEIL
jgi:UDP-glucose 4-epimerase